MNKDSTADDRAAVQKEPHWPAVAASLAVAGLYLALSPVLTAGPRWLFPGIVAVLVIAVSTTRHLRLQKANHLLGTAAGAILTLFLLGSIFLLVRELPTRSESPTALLRSAMALWASNILVFAQWYWRLDAGGPGHRDRRRGQGIRHQDGAFLFPQMSLSKDLREEMGESNWSPNFWDYLFLSFTTSTAFSPTDTLPLSRWAKILMMVQALISLLVITLLAARAVNIL
ncbi:MAG: hypothetical protein V4671_05445 [Armatimonadota bacterium]